VPQRTADAVEPALRSQFSQHLAIAAGALRTKEVENPLYVVEVYWQVAQNADRPCETVNAFGALLRRISWAKTVIELPKVTGARQIGNDIVTDLYE
jgi:hypothetical protein